MIVRLLTLTALIIFSLPARAYAQAVQTQAEQAPAPESFQLSVSLGATQATDLWSGTLGADVGVALSSSLWLGGGATALLRTLNGGMLRAGEPGELRAGFGGAWLAWRSREPQGLTSRLEPRLRVGGGHIILTDPVTGIRADAQSFLTVEPELALRMIRLGPVDSSIEARWRFVSGLDDLPGFTAGDIDGLHISLRSRLFIH